MKRKYIGLLLAVFALSGCSNDSRSDRNAITPGGGIGPVFSQFIHVTSNLSDHQFTILVKKFLAFDVGQTYEEIDIGTVKANTSSPTEGMQVRLKLSDTSSSFSSWSDIDASKMQLDIKIYDAYTYPPSQGGSGERPFNTIFAAGTGSITELGSDEVSIEFSDYYGTVWFRGSIQENHFVGHMYFFNKLNDYEGQLGSLTIPTCMLFQNICD